MFISLYKPILKGFRRKRLKLNYGTVTEISWSFWRNRRKTAVRNGGMAVDIWTVLYYGSVAIEMPEWWLCSDISFSFRSLYAEFDSEVTWRGIPVFTYYGSPLNLKSAQDYPPNICFCEHREDEPPECLKSGVLDTYNCLGKILILYNSIQWAWPIVTVFNDLDAL
jgi:hypothetical protein